MNGRTLYFRLSLRSLRGIDSWRRAGLRGTGLGGLISGDMLHAPHVQGIQIAIQIAGEPAQLIIWRRGLVAHYRPWRNHVNARLLSRSTTRVRISWAN